MSREVRSSAGAAALTVGALGVVFGDIGTSPLYAMREALAHSRSGGTAELAVLGLYGAVASLAYGFLLNMWFWPYTTGADTQLSYVAGDAVLSNLHRYAVFTFATSTWGWDVGRAVTTVVAIALLGRSILPTLRRATRRAAFDAPVTFTP